MTFQERVPKEILLPGSDFREIIFGRDPGREEHAEEMIVILLFIWRCRPVDRMIGMNLPIN
jgi:hypothetical protein